MKVIAVSTAVVTPNTKSTGDSVAIRVSSAIAEFGVLVLAAHEVELVIAAVAGASGRSGSP